MIFFYLLVAVMPLLQHPLWSASVGELTIVKYVGAAAFMCAAVESLQRVERPGLLASRQARWFFVFVLLTAMSHLVRGRDVPVGESPLLVIASFVQLFIITLVLVDSPERLKGILLTVVGSIGLASLYVLREWQGSGFASGYRPGWITGDPNYYSLSALLGLPVGLFLLRTRLAAWERWLCIGSCGLTILGLTAAASRGAFLGLAAGLCVAARRGRALRVAGLALAVLMPVMLVSPSSPLDRFFSPGKGEKAAADDRLAHWRAGLRMIAEEPLFGIGMGNFKPMASAYGESEDNLNHVAHNTYVQVAAEVGLPGFLAFVAVIFCTVRSLRECGHATASDTTSLLGQTAVAMEVGILAFAVAGCFVSAAFQKLFWLFVFLSTRLLSLKEEDTLAAGEGVESWGGRVPHGRCAGGEGTGSAAGY